MGHNSVNLAALIGSRICHDLISPIGAITNGLELLDLTGAVEGPEMDLIADSVGNAGARIRFFRVAYGAAGEQVMGRAEILSVLEDNTRGGRLSVDWMMPGDQPRALVRLAFLALQCCETAMPYGGVITIAADGDRWSVTGAADKLSIAADLWDGLKRTGDKPGITPALVQFALLPEIAAELGRKMSVTLTGSEVTIRF